MIPTYPRLWMTVVLVTAIIAACYTLLPIGESWTLAIAVVAILLVGIPHGAADHHIFQQLYRAQMGWRSMAKFYVLYLGAIGLVVLGWWLFPLATLMLFLILSAYHFGQANFHYLDGKTPLYPLLSFVWGAWVVISPVYAQYDSAAPILSALLQREVGDGFRAVLAITWLSAGLSMSVLLLAAYREIGRSLFIKECLSVGVLGLLFWQTPLLLGFGLYFSLWHAIPSAADQVRFFRLRHRDYLPTHYLRAIWPYTLLALIGLLAGYELLAEAGTVALWRVVFGGIAALTLPHIILLDRVYEQLKGETQGI